jgi:uncharacterized membrane protein YwaF
VTSTTRDRYPASEAVAGLLATCAIFLGALELFYRPFRLAPAAVILALIATLMTRTQQRLVGLAFATIGICFVAGAALQVVTHHPLF